MSLSIMIITKNEEAQIKDCLESVRFADEIILVDSGSTDKTLSIARAYATRIIETDWKGYSGTKMIALEAATGEWILWLDADERPTLITRGNTRSNKNRGSDRILYCPEGYFSGTMD